MSYATAEHDRMLAAMIKPCTVEAVQLSPPRVRVRSGEWVSGWVRWHSQAAGSARHWRVPGLGEQGILFSPSGVAAMGTFVPGLYGDAGDQPDNRDHVEVWRFADGGSLVYDWQAKRYSIHVPSGSVAIQVGQAQLHITDQQAQLLAGTILLTGAVTLDGNLQVNGNITATGTIMDEGGNSNNHSH